MHQSNGKNRRGAVGDRAVFPDRAQDDDSPDQEDNNELKQRQLSSRAPAKHAHDEEKKEISSNCVNDGRQAMFLLGDDDDPCLHRLGAYDADDEAVDTWA
jgi:hypothetical protein